jgi:hypothetical protein
MTIDARPDWAGGLIDLLDEQRAIYQQLHELGASADHRNNFHAADAPRVAVAGLNPGILPGPS